MTEEQKYLFDLQGYIVLKDVVPLSVIAGCNQSLDRLEDMHPQDFPPPLCLGTRKTEKNSIFLIFWNLILLSIS